MLGQQAAGLQVLGYGTTFVQDVPGDLSAAPSPRAVYVRDRRAALLLVPGSVLVVGLVSGLACTALFGVTHGLKPGLTAGHSSGS